MVRTAALSWAWALLLGVLVQSATRSIDLEVVNKNISPDGFNRSALLAGGTLPGKIITAYEGDTLAINVMDRTTEESMNRSTSIHWHGIFQERTAIYDGVAQISQCPIAPGDHFLYKFPLDGQTGTFWYHSHYQLQLCDGLKGPLIIYDRNDPLGYLYDVDDESTIISLTDWFHEPAFVNFFGFITPSGSLINGRGRFVNGTESPLAVINVKKGLRYRFRVIQMSCVAAYTFAIDNHPLTIIEADGIEIQPYTVDNVDIFSGQRYSVIVDANQPVGNYWIRSDPGTLQPFSGPAGFSGGINSAIFRYDGAPIADPTSQQNTSGVKALEPNMHPLFNPESPGGDEKPDVAINLVTTVDSTGLRFLVNGALFQNPGVPVLLQILSGAVHPGQIQPNGSVYILPKNKLIEVSIPGTDPLVTQSPHPFHLHGNKFSVVRSTNSSVFNFKNPVQRDTVNTGVLGDNMTFRFRTDNPGPWFLHCHIDFHLEAELAVVFAVDPEGEIAGPQSEVTTKAWEELCPKFNSLPPNET